MLKKDTKIFLAGHRGLVGGGLFRRLMADGYENVIVRTRSELDLSSQAAVREFLQAERPEVVICAAAKVGGIHANNTQPADFIGLNLGIQQNLIWESHQADVPRLLFLGSSCIYPRLAPQPVSEDALLTGPPEPTNAPYAVAKIAGMVLCDSLRKQYGRDYGTVMPPNVIGPGDNFDPQNSHVAAAMLRRFHEHMPNTPAVCWGTGSPIREFLHTDDLTDACVFLLNQDQLPSMINVGTGQGHSIREVAEAAQRVVGHTGPIEWDRTKPDGFPKKVMDVSRLFDLGWQPRRTLEDGLRDGYAWFRQNIVPAEASRHA